LAKAKVEKPPPAALKLSDCDRLKSVGHGTGLLRESQFVMTRHRLSPDIAPAITHLSCRNVQTFNMLRSIPIVDE
jgi:hypothetical protein